MTQTPLTAPASPQEFRPFWIELTDLADQPVLVRVDSIIGLAFRPQWNGTNKGPGQEDTTTLFLTSPHVLEVKESYKELKAVLSPTKIGFFQ